jgi:hypothetical protein
MKKILLPFSLMLMMILAAENGSAQVLVTYNFSAGDAATPTASHLTLTPFNRVVLTASTTIVSGVLVTTGFTTSASADTNQYVEFTATVEEGYILSLDSMGYTTQKSSAGPGFVNIGYGVAPGLLNTFSTPVAPPSSVTSSVFRWNFPDTTVGSGATIKFRFYGWASLATGGSLRLDNIILYGRIDAALPVKLSSFNAATNNDEEVVLDWTTAQEINNSHFEVEKSNDGKTFTSIGKVTGAGNSNKTNRYNFIDRNDPQTGTVYYRLKQVDFNGQYEYSKQVVVKNDLAKSFTFSVSPNPLNDQSVLSYQLTYASTVNVTIINSLGQPVFQFTQNEQLSGKHDVILPELTKGVYVVNITANGQHQTLKVLKN